jgi:prepilin-type processing-associated H-X9-DG protein
MFRAGDATYVVDVKDGLSNTVAMSESLLGDGPENFFGAIPADPQLVYAYTGFGTPLNDTTCANAMQWNISNRRGFTWASGEMRCTSYNHYYTPNSKTYDCVTNDALTFTSFAFRAARSRHPGGVNVLLGDGSVRFVYDSVDLAIWRGISTRAQGEVANDF